jgi:transmembrane sensor
LAGNTREVFLDCEGLFEVFHDSKTPFIVHANEAVITVLGTTFNVRSWSRSDQTTVAVVEGRVSLTSDRRSSGQEEVIISKNQVSILPANGSPIAPYNTDISRYLSWRQRQMYFQSVPLGEVLDQLERWYGLKFQLPDASDADHRVTIFLEDQPVDEILEVIALTNNFQYKQDGKKIRFSRKEKS